MLTAGSVPITKIATSTRIEISSLDIRSSRGYERLPHELHGVCGGRPAPCAICWRQETPVAAISVAGALPHRREQAHPADAHRQFVVLGLEAERPRHAAAAGVELGDLGAGDALQQLDRRRGAGQRLLVAVAVEEDPRPATGEPASRRSAPSSIASTSSSSTSACGRRPPAPAGRREQLHVLLAQRQQARRLAADDRHAALGSGASRSASASACARASSSRPLEMLERPQQPALSSRTSIAGGLEQLDRGAADPRLGEGRERVGEEDDLAARPAPPGAAVPAHQRLALEARQRAPARDAQRRAQRPDAPGRFESGAVAAPRRLSVRIEPNSRERSGVPWIAW